MQTLKTFVCLFVPLMLGGIAEQGSAEESVELQAVISWSGVGKMVQNDAKHPVFQGEMDGVIYVETADGLMDEAFVGCDGEQHLRYEGGTTEFDGSCLIVQSTEDTISAEFECRGEFGACKGIFRLTGGTGKFSGIQGNSSMILRSPLRHLAVSMEYEERLVVRHGVMLLPDLSYRLVEGSQ